MLLDRARLSAKVEKTIMLSHASAPFSQKRRQVSRISVRSTSDYEQTSKMVDESVIQLWLLCSYVSKDSLVEVLPSFHRMQLFPILPLAEVKRVR